MASYTILNGVLTVKTERATIDFEKQEDGTLFIEVEHDTHEYRDTCCPVVAVIDAGSAWMLAGLITGEADI